MSQIFVGSEVVRSSLYQKNIGTEFTHLHIFSFRDGRSRGVYSVHAPHPDSGRIEGADRAVHRGRRPLQNRILILLFFRLRVQFCMYKNTLDTLQVLPIV